MEFIRVGLQLRFCFDLGQSTGSQPQFLPLLYIGIITLILSKFQDSWEGYT